MNERICQNCKYYRAVEMRTRDGDIVYNGYCHACGTFPEKHPDDTCKRYKLHPKLI